MFMTVGFEIWKNILISHMLGTFYHYYR